MMNKKGFTLMELLLSVALLAIIASFSWPFFSSLQSSDLESDSIRTASIIRQASSLARTLNNDSAWGVLVDSDQVSLFAGSSYIARNQSLDQIFPLSAGVSVSSVQEIVFSKHEGVPSFNGDIVLNKETKTRIISISSLGVVNY